MKLIQQVSLLLDDGKSEKVYEVDLCEVGPDKFVVNFRQGNKGSALKDGSKTVVPVPEAEARRIFDTLVQGRLAKGWYDAADPRPKAPAPSPQVARRAPNKALDPKARADAIKERLQRKTKWRLFGGQGSPWPVSRAVWRAGELRLEDTGPLLLEMLRDPSTSGDRMLRYSLLWALGRTGPKDALPDLLAFWRGDKAAPHPQRRIAGLAYTQLAGLDERRAFEAEVKALLPDALRAALDDAVDDAVAAFDAHLEGGGAKAHEAVDLLYLLEGDAARACVLRFADTCALKPPAFQRLRHLFKAAEYREDAELFGKIAYRFEKVPAMYQKSGWSRWTHVDGDYVEIAKEMKKDEPRLAYSSATRRYLRHRVWRALRRLAERDDPAFVKMAVGVLLPFTDDDAQPVRRSSYYNWSQRRTVENHYDRFAAYWTFNHVLFRHSPRYELKKGGRFFRTKGGFKPGDPVPNVREEAFPALWDQVPEGLLHLLVESACLPVHEFAARALRANEGFLNALDTEVLGLLLARPYLVTARLAFEVAKERWDPSRPDLPLAAAMATSVLSDARQLARQWIDQDRATFAKDARLMSALVFSPFADNREYARSLLQGAMLSSDDAQRLIAVLISEMLGLEAQNAEHDSIAKEAGDTLLRAFAHELRKLGLDVIQDLLAHPLEGTQAFAAQLLLGHDVRAKDLPGDLIATLMNAKFASVRAAGVRLFGELPDEVLAERQDILAALATSPLADVRSAVRPVIQRLAGMNPDAGADLAALLVANLLRKEPAEGTHAFLLQVLKHDLKAALPHLTKEIVWRLLQAKSGAAQELGGELLKTNVKANELDVRRIAKMASHEILAVRQAAWKMYEDDTERMKREVDDAIRILDASWDDSRAFAFTYFEERFSGRDLPPKVLVAICDSVREDVQAFGRRLITKLFDEAHGSEYLLKLSEHPSAELQLFATNYLERFAAGDLEKLKGLRHYFLSVLSRVNKASVAKQRVLLFLKAEATKSEEAARFVGEVLGRQSATVAIRDKAATIEAMLALKRAFPEAEVPLVVKPIARRARKEVSDGV